MSTNSTIHVITPTTLYGYVPTIWICSIFVALFSLTTIAHIGQALLIKPRLYWLIPTAALCGVGEILGWSGRLWSSKNPENLTPFFIEITTTIISPVFLTAALYTILGLLINKMGQEYSRLKPRTYLKIFVTADVVSLLVQAGGGGIASGTNSSQSKLGSNIMLVGIFFQLVIMILYAALALEVFLRFHWNKPLRSATSSQFMSPTPSIEKDGPVAISMDGPAAISRHTRLLIIATAIATVLVFIRTIYRTAELAGGWHGTIIRTEVYFNTLDAVPVFLALLTLNILSPAFLLRDEEEGYVY